MRTQDNNKQPEDIKKWAHQRGTNQNDDEKLWKLHRPTEHSKQTKPAEA